MPSLRSRDRSRLRSRSYVALFFVGSSLALAAAGVAACSDDPASSSGSGDEGGTGPSRIEGGASTGEDGATETDANVAADASDAADATDASTKDANVADANGPGAVGAACGFNRDCQLALRCECDENTGCACKAGARGTGQNGITPCNDGNACASALCVEGPPNMGSYCSDECLTDADCGGKLPVCKDIAFVGRVCIRTPPQ